MSFMLSNSRPHLSHQANEARSRIDDLKRGALETIKNRCALSQKLFCKSVNEFQSLLHHPKQFFGVHLYFYGSSLRY